MRLGFVMFFLSIVMIFLYRLKPVLYKRRKITNVEEVFWLDVGFGRFVFLILGLIFIAVDFFG